jgi:hypothetical protein
MTASAVEPTERTRSPNLTPSTMRYKYRCIQCLEPSESLYRTYTRESTIKLSQCLKCGHNVDPYCEREWLLVVIDMVLLREEAYRHVLFNRLQGFNLQESYRKSLQLVVGSSILQAYLLWEAHRAQHPNDPLLDSTAWFVQLIAASGLKLTAFGLGIYGALLLLLAFVRRHERSKAIADLNMPTHVYLAVVLPTAWQVVTILVHIWENTATIRLLSSLLTLIYQFMAVTVVVASCLRTTSTTTTKSDDSWILSLLAIAVGLLMRAGVGLVWTVLWTDTTPLPCVGLAWPLPGTTSTNLCIL